MNEPAQSFTQNLRSKIGRFWNRSASSDSVNSGPADDVLACDRLPERAPVPLIWMLGKTGSGKSSIIQYITGADAAEVGNGYRPQTKLSREFHFPSRDDALVRFLDTRGLGEAKYDSEKEVKSFTARADLVLVTVRACDHASEELTELLTVIRKQQPDRPILLVITALHDAYPGRPHPDLSELLNDPQSVCKQSLCDQLDSNSAANRAAPNHKYPDALVRGIKNHMDQFAGHYDHAVAIDLTQVEDGFEPSDLGGDELFDAILSLLPAAMRQTLTATKKMRNDLQVGTSSGQIDRVILIHATLAAGAAVVPIAWVDLPVVIGIQSNLVHRLAKRHGQKVDAKTLAPLSALLGTRAAVRLGIRSTAKLIPVVGSAVNSAAAFAFVFATGMALDWYFDRAKQGDVPSSGEIETFYEEQLKAARHYWKQRNLGEMN